VAVSRVVYVNGRYAPYGEAVIHVEDRGFQFADSVYEVIEVLGSRLIDETRHMDRLQRSLRELSMPEPMSRKALGLVIRETIRRNSVRDGVVYLQVSRGTAGPRDFAFPPKGTQPTLVVIARHQNKLIGTAQAASGIAVITAPDIRWGRSDIKTVMLLPACLAKAAAKAHGAREAWFVDGQGFVTEGASSNAWIVTADGTLVTRQLDHRILGGVTRRTTLEVAAAAGVAVQERGFTVSEAFEAREAFITSATNTVMPVISVDGRTIGDGRPGRLTLRLRSEFHHIAETSRL
jgi:D-alanine transaminase